MKMGFLYSVIVYLFFNAVVKFILHFLMRQEILLPAVMAFMISQIFVMFSLFIQNVFLVFLLELVF